MLWFEQNKSDQILKEVFWLRGGCIANYAKGWEPQEFYAVIGAGKNAVVLELTNLSEILKYSTRKQ